MNRYQKAIAERTQEGLLRTLPQTINGIDFYSNDYLGFSKNPILLKAINDEAKLNASNQTGSTGSRLLSGNSPYFEKVEKTIAQFHGVESALICNSGYTANLGLLSAIANQEDTLLLDELIHASLIDGARLSRAKKTKFKHNDLRDLEQKLSTIEGNKIVVVESIYSMDGDVCPLKSTLDLCKKYGAKLIVDEAHAIGVLGIKGEGLSGQLGIIQEVFAIIVTYGKAMGCHGAAILGKQWLKDYLVNFSRPFIFTTAPSYHQLSAIYSTYQFVAQAKQERAQLKEVVQYLNQKQKKHSLSWVPSNTQIQAVIIPGNKAVMKAAQHLQDNGIIAMGIRYPSVAKGVERIRICLHAFNTKEQIDYLLEQLDLFYREARTDASAKGAKSF